MSKENDSLFFERTQSNLPKRGTFYFTSTLSLTLYVIIPSLLLIASILYLQVAFPDDSHRVNYLQQAFGSKANSLLTHYLGKVANMTASDEQTALEMNESLSKKLNSIFTFTELKYGLFVSALVGLVIYMRVVVMTRLIVFSWLRRLIFGAKPDDVYLLDFLTLKKERNLNNVTSLIDTLHDVTSVKSNEIDLVLLDFQDGLSLTNDVVHHYLNSSWKLSSNRVISLNGMGIASIDLARQLLSKNSRALIVSTTMSAKNGATTACFISNNAKDIKKAKYVLVKCESSFPTNDSSIIDRIKKNGLNANNYSHVCFNFKQESDLINAQKEFKLSEFAVTSNHAAISKFNTNTTSWNVLEFIENKKATKRDETILQVDCSDESSRCTSVVWRVV
ncbi:hypothetical protein C9374_009678 [Naegleria lovaniensis]|uniref:Uncharacterized protein n=1 Tax=Naegleria lovaniensis TaxID=51637 RepID=A0AA88H5D8_NAELO|nr:uncharacterized protein C9374_009678 [Naegleria lovaniensis]KAG2393101.1 hypothetical protein C9374_009678 [Naegleria lovaniensis]